MAAADKLLFLAELFPSANVEDLHRLCTTPPTASYSIERLVDHCLSSGIAGSETASPSDPGHDADMVELTEGISLLPPTLDLTGDSDTDDDEADDDGDATMASPTTSNPLTAFRSANHDTRPALVARALQLFRRVVRNVLLHPDEEKYRKIQPSKQAFLERVQQVKRWSDVAAWIGFRPLLTSATVSPSDYESAPLLLLTNDDFTPGSLEVCARLLDEEIEHWSSSVTASAAAAASGSASLKRKGKTSLASSSSSSSSSSATHTAPRPPTKRMRRQLLADAVSKRLQPSSSSSSPPAAGQIIQGRVADFTKLADVRQQIRSIRQAQRHKWTVSAQGRNRRRMMTVADLEASGREEQAIRAKFATAYDANGKAASKMRDNIVKLGKEALQYTNEFRAKHNLPPLQWHQEISDIGAVHSLDMAEGRVPFSHQGFNERVKQYPLSHRGAGENVAWNHGYGESRTARVTVDGWIDSPGHRKNLLGNWTYCGIGVVERGGKFYFTQLFART